MTVNELIYRGNLDGHGIAEFICNSLTTYDKKCAKVIDPNYVDPEVNPDVEPIPAESTSIFWTLFFIIIGFVILFLIMIYAYKKIVKREISQDMNQ